MALGIEVGGTVVLDSRWQAQEQLLASLTGEKGIGGKKAGVQTFQEFLIEDLNGPAQAAVTELAMQFASKVKYRGVTPPTGKLGLCLRVVGPRTEGSVRVAGLGRGTAIYTGIFDLDKARNCVPTGREAHSAGIKYWELWEKGIRPFKLTKKQIQWYKMFLQRAGLYIPGLKDKREFALPASKTGRPLNKRQSARRQAVINKAVKAGKLFLPGGHTTKFGARSGWHPGFPPNNIFEPVFERWSAAVQNQVSTAKNRYLDSLRSKIGGRGSYSRKLKKPPYLSQKAWAMILSHARGV